MNLDGNNSHSLDNISHIGEVVCLSIDYFREDVANLYGYIWTNSIGRAYI